MPNVSPRLLTKYYQAVELRKIGKSYNEIADQLHIAKGTASLWLKDIELSDETRRILLDKRNAALPKAHFVLANKKSELEKALQERANVIVGSLGQTQNDYILLTSMLFWAEGSKALDRLGLTNSDPKMIQLFLKLLRKAFNINESKLRVTLHLHDYQDEEDEKIFWAKITGIPFRQFHKTYLKPNTGTRKKANYHGCVTLIYYDSFIARTLTSVYNTYTDSVTMHKGV